MHIECHLTMRICQNHRGLWDIVQRLPRKCAVYELLCPPLSLNLIKVLLIGKYNDSVAFVIFVASIKNNNHQLFIVACGMHNLWNNSSLGNIYMLSFGRINGNWALFFRFSPTLIFSNMIYLLDLLSKTQVDSVISSQSILVSCAITGRVHNQVKVKPTRALNIWLFRLCRTRVLTCTDGSSRCKCIS